MNEVSWITYGFVLGVLLAGGVGWLWVDWLAKEKDHYRRLFLKAAGEIERARREK